jgi:hypothetical protein
VLSPTMTFVGTTLVLHSSTDPLDPRGAMAMLVLYVIAIVTIGILLARRQASARRVAQRTAQLQAWQLRQLMPS